MKFLLPALSLASIAQALHFYIDGTTPKCFYEELPKSTLVVGHYVAKEWNEQGNEWQQHEGINIYISVDVSLPKAPFFPPSMEDNTALSSFSHSTEPRRRRITSY